MTPANRFVISVPVNFSLHSTIHAHGWHQLAPLTLDEPDCTLHAVEELTDGSVAAVSMRQTTEGIEVECSTDGHREEIGKRVERMLQLDIDLAPFYSFCEDYAELSHIPRRCVGRMQISSTLFEDIVKVIATTNTTWAQTKGMARRLVENFGKCMPQTDKRAFPTAHGIAMVSPEQFFEKAKMGYRNAAVHKIATDVVQGKLDLVSFRDPEMPIPELRRRLLALPGVGPYAAACLMLYLGRPGMVCVDSWARTLLSRELGHPVTDKEVHGFFARYGEWQALAYFYYDWKKSESGA